MKRFLLPILAALALPNAVNANVDPEIAEFCMKAADFQGCVKAMTTKPTNSQNMRIIRGETEVTGNTCPDNHAYTGGGYCQRVMCDGLNWWVREFSARHDPLLEGKGWKCQGQKKLMLTGYPIKATVSDKCPLREPIVGTTSSCVTQFSLDVQAGKIDQFGNPITKDKEASTGSVKINCDSPVWKNKPRCN